MELTAEFIDTAMSLSDNDRAELAHRLFLSLKVDKQQGANAVIDWEDEIEERLRKIDRDPSRLRDADTALNEIKERLKARRESWESSSTPPQRKR
jgi:hypothetical protein